MAESCLPLTSGGPERARALAMVDAAGLRRTPAAVAVAAVFARQSSQALSHAQTLQALGECGVAVNRVTLYRLLARFVGAGLLVRQLDAQHVGRFALQTEVAAQVPRPAAAAHFECTTCHTHIALTTATQKVQKAAQQTLRALQHSGHQGHSIDLSIRGTCGGCAAGRGAAAPGNTAVVGAAQSRA
ncbi:MAG: Fur family transcriptional regulator [Burkholderiaceae bacterium]